MRRLPLALAALLLPAAAGALEFTSVYTDFDVKRCRKVAQPKHPLNQGAWICPGHGRIDVRIEVSDERMAVTFGPGRTDDQASFQTFPGFNDVYAGRIEWRLRMGTAFAAILRWNVMTGADQEKATGPTRPSGRVLVVTRLGPGGSCHVGYVDAAANPNANELARQIADEKAQAFRCGKTRPRCGARGRRRWHSRITEPGGVSRRPSPRSIGQAAVGMNLMRPPTPAFGRRMISTSWSKAVSMRSSRSTE